MLLLARMASRFNVSDAATELVSRAALMIWSFRRFVFFALLSRKGNVSENVLCPHWGFLQNIFHAVSTRVAVCPCIGRSCTLR